MAVKIKLWKVPGLVIYSYLKESELTVVKGMYGSELGILKGHHLSTEGV